MSDIFPMVDVSVVLVVDARGERVLLDFNRKWGCFTLPMSKRRAVPGAAGRRGEPESGLAAATRAAAEVLGRPLAGGPAKLEVEVPPYTQSGRDGSWKRYRYQVYAVACERPPQPLPGHSAVWVWPEDLDGSEPLSPTVRAVLRAVPFDEVRTKVGK